MKNKAKIESQQITKSTISNLPDIYYIILDGYTSGSILKEIYNYDNIGFYDYLTKKGFYVSEKSMSNYSTTYLSLWSSLNFSYINELDDGVPLDRIGDNKVFRFLRQHGYDVVAFSSTGDMEIEDVDLHIKPKWSIDGFSNQLLNTTPLFILLTKITREGIWYSLYRNNILDAFENLIDKAEFKNPTFVFVHIAAPHPPFVFDEKGGALSHDRMFSCNDGSDFMREGGTTEEYVEGYRKQVIFISKKIEGVIDRIISDSVEKPIIILQGDHGSRSMYDRFSADRTYFRECFSILNAYYFPDSDYVRLYDKVTPVNTFRIIFNQYFETDHELLEDRSYFLPSGQRDRPIEVTDEL